MWRMKYLRRRSYDLIHAFETRPTTIYPVCSLLRRAPAPLVIDWNDWWGRGGLIRERRPRWYQLLFGGVETWFEEHFRPQANHTTVISSSLAQRAIGLGVPQDTITILRGGVDVSAFPLCPPTAFREAFGIAPTAFVAMYSAADATMDVDLVLHAIQLACQKIPQLVLVMTGHQLKRFRERLQSAGLHNHVRHLGFLDRPKLIKALLCADVFLLPLRDSIANRGRWPHKIGEYMASGRPTITNPVGDIRWLFNSFAVGLLCEPSAEAMADAIERLYGEPDLRANLGQTARSVAERDFSWPVIVDRLESAYRDVQGRWKLKHGERESRATRFSR